MYVSFIRLSQENTKLFGYNTVNDQYYPHLYFCDFFKDIEIKTLLRLSKVCSLYKKSTPFLIAGSTLPNCAVCFPANLNFYAMSVKFIEVMQDA